MKVKIENGINNIIIIKYKKYIFDKNKKQYLILIRYLLYF